MQPDLHDVDISTTPRHPMLMPFDVPARTHHEIPALPTYSKRLSSAPHPRSYIRSDIGWNTYVQRVYLQVHWPEGQAHEVPQLHEQPGPICVRFSFGTCRGGRMEKQRARRREESGGGGEAYPLCMMVSKDVGSLVVGGLETGELLCV